MQVSIIIINYNTFEITCNCIASVQKFTAGIDYEIVLVDNCSTKDNPDDFKQRFPGIKLVKSPVNGGFAKGNNLGIAHAAGDIILLLNSDTLLTENSIAQAANYLLAQKAEMLTVRLNFENGKYQRNARRFRSLKNETLDLFRPMIKKLPYKRRAALMLNQYFYGDFDTRCDWISGAFMMFPRGMLSTFADGKLDERYFMYGEDQLWCLQLHPEGNGCHFLSSTAVIHIENASMEPGKQYAHLKRRLQRETDLIKIREGKGLYYWSFWALFTAKEYGLFGLKMLFKRFGKEIG